MLFFYFQDCFIVDNGEAGIWVWTGKRASPKERRESMTNAMVKYLLHFIFPFVNCFGVKDNDYGQLPEMCLLTMSLGNEMCLERCLVRE